MVLIREQPVHTPPETPEAVLGIHRSNLTPEVRTYADNLRDQVRQIFQNHNVKTIPEFETAARARTIPLEKVREVQNLLRALRTVIETGKLPESAYIFTIPNALNPYREALLASGIAHIDQNPITAERTDITLNLQETLTNTEETYQSMGLPAWAENIATADLTHLTPEKRTIIEQEIKNGAIPLWMPGKETQRATTVAHFKTAFKPIWVKDGQEQSVQNAYLAWDHFIRLITTKAHQLVEGVPDRPYIALMHPTQKPDDRTTNKTVAEQLQAFTTINTERAAAQQAPVHVTNPHEYGALQTIHSRQTRDLMPGIPTTLTPIDSTTWTRFITLPLSSVRVVPFAAFNPGLAQALFDGGDAVRGDAAGGFRLSVRVEL